MNIKKTVITVSLVVSILFNASSAFAHVVVKPNQAGVGATQGFSVGVPNEKDNPTIGLRLVIPEGLMHVSPNVKLGWTINVKQEGASEDAAHTSGGSKVTEISWTGGSIPAGQRDDFMFTAQVPSSETTLKWNAYQTYQDGTVVSWDQDPETMKKLSENQKEENEKQGKGPLSVTKVVNDLNSKPQTSQTATKEVSSINSKLPLILSVVAIALASYSLVTQNRKKT
jgi:uncharacterized protein YcnI